MKIAVVGGIGTGKSTIMQMFDKLGGITIYTDKLNKELLEDKEYIALIKDTFDNIVIDNKIDKKALRNLIVNNEKARLQLNAIAHPRIINKINELTTGNGLYFVEIPLFNEISNLVEFDKICAVKASDEIRIKRIMNRDNISEDNAKKIIQAQKSEQSVFDIADYIINNEESFENILKQAEEVFKKCSIG